MTEMFEKAMNLLAKAHKKLNDAEKNGARQHYIDACQWKVEEQTELVANLFGMTYDEVFSKGQEIARYM